MPFDLLQEAPVTYFRHQAAHPLAGVTVLQIVPDLDGGGEGQAAIEIAAALAEAGGRALVAGRPGALVSELQAKGGIFLPFPMRRNPLALALSMRRLARLIEIQGVNIVHARSRLPGWVGFGAARLTRTPLVTTYHASYASGSAPMLRYNSVMARGDRILADSNSAALLLSASRPSAAFQIRVVRPGVDARQFNPDAVAPSRVEALRRSWKIAPDEPIVILASSLRLPPEAARLLDVASLLTQTAAGSPRVIFMGSGPDPAAYAFDLGGARRTRPNDLLRPLGPCHDRPATFLAASVVAVPAPSERWCVRTVLEAQAMGTPVIPGPSSLLDEIELAPPEPAGGTPTWWRASFDDPSAAAARIKTVLGLGASARDAIAARARAQVEACFSVERMCEDTLAAYAELQHG